MSSFIRNIQRKNARKRANYEPATQPTIVRDDHYMTLRPTKGWQRVSYRRLAAQRRMAAIFEIAHKRSLAR